MMNTFIKVVLIAFLWVTVVNCGDFFGNGDTGVRLQMTHAWWTGTLEVSPDVKPVARNDNYPGVVGRNGKRRQIYEPGQSLLMLPGDWLGTQINQKFPQLSNYDIRPLVVSLLTFIPINVAVVASCFWLLRLFNFNERIASLSCLTWLLGTTILHYCQIHQQNNQVLLCAILGYANVIAYLQTKKSRFLFFSGLILGGAILIRASNIFHVFTVFLFLISCLIYEKQLKFPTILPKIGTWILGLIPLILVGRISDYLRFGNFFTSGYSLYKQQIQTDPIYKDFPPLPENYPFIYPPYVGIFGVLFSLKKSIFIYDPLLLPCLILAVKWWKKFSPYLKIYLLSIVLNLAMYIVLTSKVDFWDGDGAWAARHHVTSVHLLLIPLIPIFIQNLLTAKKLKLWLMQAILVFAIIVQISSVMLFHQLEVRQKTWGVPKANIEFRLAQRFVNVICLINGSFSKICVSQYKSQFPLEKQQRIEASMGIYNKLPFFPFSFRRSIGNYPNLKPLSIFLFLVWGLALILAIITTVKFVLVSVN